jgi:hypothetical protein
MINKRYYLFVIQILIDPISNLKIETSSYLNNINLNENDDNNV